MNSYQAKINVVLSFIENNLHKKHQLEELAAIAHLSKYHFHRLLTAYLQEPLGKYINRLRMEMAAKSLIYTKKSVREIAFQVGYETAAAFNKSFKKQYQCSPTDYRKGKNSV